MKQCKCHLANRIAFEYLFDSSYNLLFLRCALNSMFTELFFRDSQCPLLLHLTKTPY